MSDGIIQEVFNKYLELMLIRNIQSYAFDTVRELQQELIEKIKQEHIRLSQIFCTCDQHQGKLIGFSVLREQLIGDQK